MKKTAAAAAVAASIAGAALAADESNVLVLTVAGKANGAIEIELLPDVAPLHVERIRQLAQEGAYDNVVFHRVIAGFMAQTGDVAYGRKDGGRIAWAGRGGSSGPDLPAEFSDIPFVKGIVGMARSQHPDSANSQFFIMFDDAPHLDGKYTVVGRVVAGQEVVDAIKKGDPAKNGMVEDPDYIVRVSLGPEI